MASLVAWSSWARRESCCVSAWPCWSTWDWVALAFWSTTATCSLTYFSVAQAPRLSAAAVSARAATEDFSLNILLSQGSPTQAYSLSQTRPKFGRAKAASGRSLTKVGLLADGGDRHIGKGCHDRPLRFIDAGPWPSKWSAQG